MITSDDDAGTTVMVERAVLLPSAVVAVTVVVPGVSPVTRPFGFTEATLVPDTVQVTCLLVALVGAILAFNCTVCPTSTCAVV
ncbi:hypothetical protein D3C76_1381390 [compost metagenome]